MKLYRAETGSSLSWNNNNNIETLEEFNEAIEKCTGISPEIQIILTSRGNRVTKDNVKSIVKTTDKNEEELVFCYDEDHLNAEKDIIQTVIEREVPRLRPKRIFQGAAQISKIQKESRTKSTKENCRAYKDILNVFREYTEYVMETIHTHQVMAKSIVREQKNQTMAINVGLSSLRSYRNTNEEIATNFLKQGKKELMKQSKLLATLDQDLKALEHTKLYPAILNLLEPQHRDKKNLYDFLNTNEIESIRKETKALVNDLTTDISNFENDLKQLDQYEQEVNDYVSGNTNLQWLDEVHSRTNSIIRSALMCQKDANDCYTRGQNTLQDMENDQNVDKHHKKFTTLHHLVLYILEDPVTKLDKHDDHLRKYLNEFLESKRKSMDTYFTSMRTIGNLQTHISILTTQCEESHDKLRLFKKKFGKRDIHIVRQTLFSYAGLLLEVLRRKKYSDVLIRNTGILMEILTKCHVMEETRRGYFMKTVKNLLPFTLVGFDQVAPQGEIKLIGIEENSNEDEIDEEEVSNIVSLMTSIFNSQGPGILTKQPSFSKNPKSLLKSSKTDDSPKTPSFLDVMTNHLNDLGPDFLTTIWTEFFPDKEVNTERIKQVIEQQPVFKQPRIKPDPKENDDKLKKLTEDHEKQLADLQEVIKHLEIEKESLENKVEDLQQTADSMHNESQNQKKINAFEAELIKEKYEQKLSDLNYQLDEEQIKKKNLEIELNSVHHTYTTEIKELKSILQQEQQKAQEATSLLQQEQQKTQEASTQKNRSNQLEKEIRALKAQLTQEKKKTQDAFNQKWEEKNRADQLIEDLESLKSTLELEREEKDLIQLERDRYRVEADQARFRLEEKDKAVQEIKVLQEQTKKMVKLTETDWRAKDLELKEYKAEQEEINSSVQELLSRFSNTEYTGHAFDLKRDIRIFKRTLEEFIDRNRDLEQGFQDVRELLNQYREDDSPPTQEINLKTDIKVFKRFLESFVKRYLDLKFDYDTTTEELVQLAESHKNLREVQSEWKTIASHMAEKLEEFRKNVLYELAIKLQLPLNESELNVLSRNLSPSDDDAVIWNEVLQLSSAVHTQRFVMNVLENAKNLYNNFVVAKSQLKRMKDKYRHLYVSNAEKITFRNFKVGDVALFLPTRNSTGKPWAAFNINAPHYFLQTDDATSSQMESREWIVARIVSIRENIVDENSNPYGLALGLKYFDLEVENWRTNRPTHKSKKRLIEPDSGLASLGNNDTPPKRPSYSSVSSSSSNIVHSYVNK